MNLVKFQDTKFIHKNLLHSYALITNYQKEKLRKQSHYNYIKKTKILSNKLIKKVIHLHTENYKTVMKVIQVTQINILCGHGLEN